MQRVKEYTIGQFFETFSIINSSFSNDEKSILYTSSETGVFNAFTVPVNDGPPRQLTNSTSVAIYAVSFFPRDDRILFVRDRDGNENHHLYVLDPDGRETELTPGDSVKARFLGWSFNGNYFYYETNERDRRFFDVYEMEIANFQRSLLFPNTEGLRCHSVSNDQKYVAFSKGATRTQSDIYLFNLETQETRHVTPHEGQIAFRPACFDASSRNLFYLSDENSEFPYLCCLDLITEERSEIYRAPVNVVAFRFSLNGKYRMMMTDQDGRTMITVTDQQTGKPVVLPYFGEGDIRAATFSRSDRLMSFYVGGDRNPNTLYVYDFVTTKVRKLVESLSPAIDTRHLVESQGASYTSFDGLEIPAFLWKPHQAARDNKVPGLIWAHGGPGGQTRKGYSPRIQYLVNHGYAILGPNYRGSSGYGKSFSAADDGKHGRAPLLDCVEARKYLASFEFIDSSKIGIIGASYGGYLVLAALAFAPDEFACGVDLFGVCNWLRMMESFPAYWSPNLELYYKKIGDPRTDQSVLRAISPLFHADKISKPLMVVQGANDPRVLRVEADDIVEAVRKRNGIAEYLIFEDEGHGITKRSNKIIAYDSIVKFLDKYLKGTETSQSASV